jgi:hypothetical protein
VRSSISTISRGPAPRTETTTSCSPRRRSRSPAPSAHPSIRSRSGELATYGALELGGALWAFAVPGLIGLGETATTGIYDGLRASPAALAAVRFGIALLATLPASLCRGTTFPAVAATLPPNAPSLGSAGAGLYAANLLGGAPGAALSGFWLLSPVAAELAAVPRNTDDRPRIGFLATQSHAGGSRGKLDPMVGLRWARFAEALRRAARHVGDDVHPDLDAEARGAAEGGAWLQTAAALWVAGSEEQASRALAAASALLPRHRFADAAADPTAAEVWGPERQ